MVGSSPEALTAMSADVHRPARLDPERFPMTEHMQSCKILEINGVDPKRALLEIRDGKYWDGEPATTQENGTTPMPDGFYFVELTGDGRILNNDVYGPYADAVAAELAARESPTLADLNAVILQLERDGRVQRVVGEDGVARYGAGSRSSI
jgi:hypothetical protein